MDALTSVGEAIGDVCERLNLINQDLDRMPGIKRGSKWHLDRVSARQNLLAERERLFNEQARLLADRPEAAVMRLSPGHPVAEALMS